MIHVTLTTEEGVMLDSFSIEEVESNILGRDLSNIELSKQVRSFLEHRYEVEDL